MEVYILVYKGFAQFESIIPSYIASATGKVYTVGIDKAPVRSFEGFTIIPDFSIDEVEVDKVDAFIIPGGNPEVLYPYNVFYELLVKIDNSNKVLGGICSGVIHLAKAGLLENRAYTTSVDIREFKEFEADMYQDANVVVSKNLITAKATGYVEFGIILGEVLNLYEDERDNKETRDFFMRFGEQAK